MRSKSKQNTIYALVLASAILLTFIQVPKFDFLNLDDQAHIEKNDAVKAFDLPYIWTHEHKDMYIPVLYSVLAIESFVSPGKATFHEPNLHVKGLDPLVFHATSVLLHTANCVLVFYFLLGFGFAPLLSVLGALIYGVHPLQVEVVAWVSAQKDLVSSFWALISLLYFQRHFISEDASPLNLKKYIKMSVLVLLAILSKPTTVIIAPILFFWWVFIKRRDWFTGGVWLSLPLFLSVTFAIVTAGQQPGDSLPFKTNILERFWVSLDTITFYLNKFLWPANLSVEYGRNPPYFLSSPDRYWTWAPALVLIFAAYKLWSKMSDEVKLGVAIIGAGLLPVLGIKSFVYQNVSTVSDRYMSVPMLGVSLILISGLQWLISKNPKPFKTRALLSAFFLVCGAWAVTSFSISTHWRNIDSLWSRVIAVNPQSWFAYNNWAAHFELKGERVRAIELYEKSLALRPNSMVFTRVGILYYDENNREKARQAFQEALRLDPMNSIARQNLNVQ